MTSAEEPTLEQPPDGSGRQSLRWSDLRPWIGTAARLLLAAVFLYAGASKVSDLEASGRAVNAYDVMPVGLGQVVGAALPMLEVALGLLMLAGFATRIAASLLALMNIVFIAGIAQAWARGLSIDCGCFGGDGQLAAGADPKYKWEILRDIGFLVCALFVVVYPRTRLSLDARLAGPEEIE